MENANVITVEELVKGILSKKSINAREDYLKNAILLTRDYVPYKEKMVRAENIVEITSRKRNPETGEIILGGFHFNGNIQNLLIFRALIEMYTNIAINSTVFDEEFDMLSSCKFTLMDENKSERFVITLLDYIMNLIPESEYTLFLNMISTAREDLVSNEYELHSFVSNQVDRLTNILNIIIEPFINQLGFSAENGTGKLEAIVENLVSKYRK